MFKRPTEARVVPGVRGASDPSNTGIDPDLLTLVRPGAYVLTSEWESLFNAGRLRTRAHAVARRTSNSRAANSHVTAAAIHRLPLYKVRGDRVELIVPEVRGRRNGRDVVRHHMPLPTRDVVVIDGLRVTSLERTVYDVIRATSLATALVCFDAALRSVAWDDETNSYDHGAAESFRAAVRRRIAANSGARGIRQARFVADFADGRAQGPGESVSRLWMWQLGLPTPELQFRVDFPDGTYALLDFAWPRLGRWGEFDGRIKYQDAEILAGRTLDEVLAEQQHREDKIRALTGWSCDRWGFDSLSTVDEFAGLLRAIGLYPSPA